MDFKLAEIDNMQYITAYPKDLKNGEKYPVILFLHGAGTRGRDIVKLKNNKYFEVVKDYEDFQFITVAPLCHENTWFDMIISLKKLVYKIAENEKVDNKKLYLMGNSMGGYATWLLAMSIPEMFAAIVPICGGGMYWNARRLVNIPVWAFHGKEDTTVFVEESEKMVAAVNKNGGKAKLTVYPGCGHDSWSKTYRNPEVFAWLLSNEKNNNSMITDKYNDSELYG